MISFSVEAKAIGLLCVGYSYPSAMGIDLPFARMRKVSDKKVFEEVYIPGSSFKGSLRSACSRIADAYGFKSCGEIRPEAIQNANEKQGICDVCKLFGYPKNSMQNILIVSDLEPSEPVKMLELSRIRIEDSSLKAAEGALFTMEFVTPGAIFKGKINLTNVEQDLAGLLLLGMAELRMDRIGRSSIIDLRISNTEVLEKALDGTRWLVLVEDLKEWLWR